MYIVWNFGVEMLKTLACMSMDWNAAYFAVRSTTTDRKFTTTNNINKEEKTTNTLNGVNAYRQLLLSSSFVTTGFALE